MGKHLKKLSLKSSFYLGAEFAGVQVLYNTTRNRLVFTLPVNQTGQGAKVLTRSFASCEKEMIPR